MSQQYFRWRGGHLNTVSDGAIYLELNEQQAKKYMKMKVKEI